MSTAPSMLQAAQSAVASLSSSSTGSSIEEEVVSALDNIYIAGWHVPLALFVVLVVFLAIFLVCAVVGVVCSGCLNCVDKTETVVDETVQDVKGYMHGRDLNSRKSKLALLKAKQSRSDDSV